MNSLESAESQSPTPQIDVSDHPMIWRWMQETAKHDIEGFVCLTRGNVNAFLARWGKPVARWKDKNREWTHAWNVTEEGISWLILSGPQSSAYRLRYTGSKEAYLADPRVADGAVTFLKKLLTQLST